MNVHWKGQPLHPNRRRQARSAPIVTAATAAGRPASGAALLRSLTLLLFVVSTIGTTLDLVLLGHFENPRQLAPLLLMPTGLLLLAWHRIEQGPLGTRAFQAAMVLFIASGVGGVWFHYSSNAAFELQIRPAIGGWSVVRESLTGPAPALAPATLAQLGMLGLIYTYRHPFLERKPSRLESGAVLAKLRLRPTRHVGGADR